MRPAPDRPAALRVALSGYGFAGRNFHAPLIGAAGGLTLAAVVSSRPEAVAADLPEVPVVATLDEALELADLVVLAGPHHTHAPQALLALRRGRHVVVDKPMSLSLAEARGLAAAAVERQRVLAVFHNRRWDNDFLTLRQLVAGGQLGRVVHFESRFDRFRPQVRDRWREQPGPSGGLWFDLGPHLVDQALQLFGPPDRVVANLARQRDAASTDDWAHVVLTFGERRAVLQASLVAAAALPRFAVHGLGGSWVKHGVDVQEGQLLAGLGPGTAGWGLDPAPSTRVDAAGQTHLVPLQRGEWDRFYPAVRDAVSSGGAGPVAPDEAVAVMAVMDAAFVAASSGAAVEPDFSDAERAALTRAAACA